MTPQTKQEDPLDAPATVTEAMKKFVAAHPFAVYDRYGFNSRYQGLRCAARTVEFLGKLAYMKHDVTGEIYTYFDCVALLNR